MNLPVSSGLGWTLLIVARLTYVFVVGVCQLWAAEVQSGLTGGWLAVGNSGDRPGISPCLQQTLPSL